MNNLNNNKKKNKHSHTHTFIFSIFKHHFQDSSLRCSCVYLGNGPLNAALQRIKYFICMSTQREMHRVNVPLEGFYTVAMKKEEEEAAFSLFRDNIFFSPDSWERLDKSGKNIQLPFGLYINKVLVTQWRFESHNNKNWDIMIDLIKKSCQIAKTCNFLLLTATSARYFFPINASWTSFWHLPLKKMWLNMWTCNHHFPDS